MIISAIVSGRDHEFAPRRSARQPRFRRRDYTRPAPALLDHAPNPRLPGGQAHRRKLRRQGAQHDRPALENFSLRAK